MKRNEFNFIANSVSAKDIELFLGPFDDNDGPFITFDSSWTMAHIMHAAGIFKSISDARRNGWNKPIEPGFQSMVVSKKKIAIFILNTLKEID